MRGQKTQQPKEVLSPSEVQALRDEQKELQTAINEAKGADGSSRTINVNKLQAKANYLEKAIQERTIDAPKGREKDRLYREEAELADKLAVGMPTQWEMDRPAKNPGAVDKNLNWNKRNDGLIRRWVEIQNAKVAAGEERRYLDSLRREK